VSKLSASMALGAVLTWGGSVHADCVPRSHLSTCIDADTLWPHPGPGYFGFIGGTDTTAAGQAGFAVVTTYAARPIVLMVPTTQPNGTEVAVVDDLWDATFLFSLGLTDRLEVGAALPITLGRTGTGVSVLTSQTPASLPRATMRDARLGATFSLAPRAREFPGDAFGVAARFELALPTGDESTFAGDRSVVGMPSFAADFRNGAFMAGGELGARLRQTSELVGSRVGSQLVVAFGIGAELREADKLSLHLEAMGLPTFVGQDELGLDPNTGKRVASSTRPPLLPAEWQVSVRSAELMDGDLSASVGFGTSIGLTGDSAITSPSVRAIFSIRYAPLGRTKATE
jgi:OmpA-OmpF porin, OOP family